MTETAKFVAKTSIISRKSLHGELVPLVRNMVIGGELQPGDKIPEQALCERFGVSRTPLREALKVLAAEGLLQLSLNRGATVAKITSEEVDQLFPIMGALEGLAGESACVRMSRKQFSHLQQLHDDMLEAYERGEWGLYIRLNRDIHESLFEFAGNAALSALYNSLMVRIHSVRFVAKKSPQRWKQAVQDHEKLMAALRARNAPLVREILHEHLRHKAEMVHEAMGQGAIPAQNAEATDETRVAPA
jgi:DNA-binding GntR family transcriptional regulator